VDPIKIPNLIMSHNDDNDDDDDDDDDDDTDDDKPGSYVIGHTAYEHR